MADESIGPDGVFARFSPFLDAYVQFVVEAGRVVSVSFPEHPSDSALPEHPLLDRIESYLGGTTRADFDDVPISIDESDEMVTILTAVRSIPYGKARSVEEMVAEIPSLDPDDEEDLAQVREALDANQTPILIPDHRVRAAPSGAPPRIEQRLRSLERIVT